MGSKPAPSYANINMAQTINPKIRELALLFSVNGESPIKLLKIFLDDIFMVWTGSVSNLHMFFNEINKIHETLKFSMAHATPKNT